MTMRMFVATGIAAAGIGLAAQSAPQNYKGLEMTVAGSR